MTTPPHLTKQETARMLLKWFEQMEDVNHPKKLARKYWSLYDWKIIGRALRSNICTNRSNFTRLCEYYKTKQLDKTTKQE